MIFDLFLYNGERSLLDIRINEFQLLEPLKKFMPVKHIAVSGLYTFTGIKQTIDPVEYHPDLHHAIDYNPNFSKNPWENEARLRNALKSALTHLFIPDLDDIIIISDIDEIPRPYAIQHYKPEFGMMALQQDVYQFYLNTRAQRQSWIAPRIMPWSYLKDKEPDEVRRSGFDYCLYGGGWHMTFQGGIETIQKKFASFSHQEPEVQKFNDKELLESKMKNLRYLWEDYPLEVVGDSELPYYLTKNREKFKDMLWH